jgi:hypothetical protein
MTHSLAEWVQMVSLAVALYAVPCVPYFLLVDAEVWAWPRPAVDAVEAVWPTVQRAGDWLLVAVAAARLDVREMAVEARLYALLSLRDAALTGAALLALLLPTTEVTR